MSINILERPHSPQLAEQIGEAWEVCLGVHAPPLYYEGIAERDGTDWFRVEGVHFDYVSDRAKAWLEQNVPEWVSFEQVPVTEGSG